MWYKIRPFFFFNDTATTEIYTLSLHEALPISNILSRPGYIPLGASADKEEIHACTRSEEHTSELQSHSDLVSRLLLEKNTPFRAHRKYRRSRIHAGRHRDRARPSGPRGAPSSS